MAEGMVVTVHDEMVKALVDKVWLALQPSMLEAFLVTDAHNYFAEQIELRFAWEGDAASGEWPRLSEATENIRAHAGFSPDGPINERTGQLLRYVTEHYDSQQLGLGAEMQIPGSATGEMERKIRHAQAGAAPGENPMFPGSSTPARPVLAVNEEDVLAIVAKLEMFIAGVVVGS